MLNFQKGLMRGYYEHVCEYRRRGERERESTEGREDIVAGAKAASVAASKWIVGGVRRIVREREKQSEEKERAWESELARLSTLVEVTRVGGLGWAEAQAKKKKRS